jgi:hypothetical protein
MFSRIRKLGGDVAALWTFIWILIVSYLTTLDRPE